jgi:hypothetical protein
LEAVVGDIEDLQAGQAAKLLWQLMELVIAQVKLPQLAMYPICT